MGAGKTGRARSLPISQKNNKHHKRNQECFPGPFLPPSIPLCAVSLSGNALGWLDYCAEITALLRIFRDFLSHAVSPEGTICNRAFTNLRKKASTAINTFHSDCLPARWSVFHHLLSFRVIQRCIFLSDKTHLRVNLSMIYPAFFLSFLRYFRMSSLRKDASACGYITRVLTGYFPPRTALSVRFVQFSFFSCAYCAVESAQDDTPYTSPISIKDHGSKSILFKTSLRLHNSSVVIVKPFCISRPVSVVLQRRKSYFAGAPQYDIRFTSRVMEPVSLTTAIFLFTL